MQVDWLLLTLGVLVAVAYFGFIGGVAGALVGGGREDRSLPASAAIGFVGAVIGSAVWVAVMGKDFELGAGGTLSALAGSIVLLVVWTAVRLRRKPAGRGGVVTG